MYIKIPRKIAHIVNPEPNKEMPGVPKTYCGMAIIAHGEYFRETHKGKVCPECERLAAEQRRAEAVSSPQEGERHEKR